MMPTGMEKKGAMIDYGQFCQPPVQRHQAGSAQNVVNLLTQRLRKLEQMGVVERRRAKDGFEYHLTAAGEELRPIVVGIGHWGRDGSEAG